MAYTECSRETPGQAGDQTAPPSPRRWFKHAGGHWLLLRDREVWNPVPFPRCFSRRCKSFRLLREASANPITPRAQAKIHYFQGRIKDKTHLSAGVGNVLPLDTDKEPSLLEKEYRQISSKVRAGTENPGPGSYVGNKKMCYRVRWAWDSHNSVQCTVFKGL